MQIGEESEPIQLPIPVHPDQVPAELPPAPAEPEPTEPSKTPLEVPA
jgi:hypothetical protein